MKVTQQCWRPMELIFVQSTDQVVLQAIRASIRNCTQGQQGTELFVQAQRGQNLCRSTASGKHKFVQTEPHRTVCVGGPGSNWKDSQEYEDDGRDGNVRSGSAATGSGSSGSLAAARDALRYKHNSLEFKNRIA